MHEADTPEIGDVETASHSANPYGDAYWAAYRRAADWPLHALQEGIAGVDEALRRADAVTAAIQGQRSALLTRLHEQSAAAVVPDPPATRLKPLIRATPCGDHVRVEVAGPCRVDYSDDGHTWRDLRVRFVDGVFLDYEAPLGAWRRYRATVDAQTIVSAQLDPKETG